LRLPAVLAPVKATILPLINKDRLPEIAQKIYQDLRWEFSTIIDDQGVSIGKRYRRQDAAGTPFCITVDHETIENNTVTLRHRDTMEQQRMTVAEVKHIISEAVNMKTWLQKTPY
jgi:glycyl-tRNA synthetase